MKKIFVNIALLLAGLLFGVIITENLAGYYLKKSTLGRKIAYLDSKSVPPSRYQKLSRRQFDLIFSKQNFSSGYPKDRLSSYYFKKIMHTGQQ